MLAYPVSPSIHLADLIALISFACAIYRRTTRYIRIPTTLIGLIDASVSNRVAVNWNGLKNRLGAYHEPLHTIIDTTFLKTLPQAEIRNGIAEILKISSCAHLATFEAVEKYGSRFIEQRFGHVDGSREVVAAVGDVVIRQSKSNPLSHAPGHMFEQVFPLPSHLLPTPRLTQPPPNAAIRSVLTVEIPNPREHNLNRIMYFGHTWSPVLELSTTPPLLHGHAISIDMCFSAAIAHHLGLLDTAHYEQFLRAFSSLGLALDHPAFTVELMRRATAAAVRTRDGLLRAPVPVRGLGECEILMMVEGEVLEKAFEGHKRVVGGLLRGGLGVEVDVAVRCARVVNGH